MDTPAIEPTTSGPAYRVTLLAPQQAEAYQGVYVRLDAQRGVVHLYSADGQTHYLTLPAGATLIEWLDPAVLEPRPRVPAFGARAWEQFGEQIQRMSEGVGRAFGAP